MTVTDPYKNIGDAVYAALTAEDKAELAKAMRDAAKSDDDDWRCALGNAGIDMPNEPGRRVTAGQIRTMCEYLADAKANDWTEESDWDRLLDGAFGSSSERYRPLYESVPLGDDGTQPRKGRR